MIEKRIYIRLIEGISLFCSKFKAQAASGYIDIKDKGQYGHHPFLMGYTPVVKWELSEQLPGVVVDQLLTSFKREMNYRTAEWYGIGQSTFENIHFILHSTFSPFAAILLRSTM